MPAHPNNVSGARIVDGIGIAFDAVQRENGSWHVRVVDPDGTIYESDAEDNLLWPMIGGMVGATVSMVKDRQRQGEAA